MEAVTIDDIILSLEKIINDCIAANSRLGYFAALYLKVTKSVKEGIVAGRFNDGPRMEKLDVVFAGRYLDAYNKWKSGQQPTGSWTVAFEQAERASVLALQHLLLGMNAHINLDLGVAAAEVCEGKPIADLKQDFDSINTVIASLTYEVLSELGRISPLLSLLGLHSTNNSPLIQFSIDNARDGAWCFAEDISQLKDAAYDTCLAQRDATIKQLGQSIVGATGAIRLTIWFIHLFEFWRKPSKIITILNEYQKEKIVINTTSVQIK